MEKNRLKFAIGETDVAVTSGTSTRATIAKILGREKSEDCEVIYLDRLVHRVGDEFEGGRLGGCVSTILYLEKDHEES